MATALSALLLSILVTSGIAAPPAPAEPVPPEAGSACQAETAAHCPAGADRLRAYAGANLRHRIFQIAAEAAEDAVGTARLFRPEADRPGQSPSVRDSGNALPVLRQTEPASSLFIVTDRPWPGPRGSASGH